MLLKDYSNYVFMLLKGIIKCSAQIFDSINIFELLYLYKKVSKQVLPSVNLTFRDNIETWLGC